MANWEKIEEQESTKFENLENKEGFFDKIKSIFPNSLSTFIKRNI